MRLRPLAAVLLSCVSGSAASKQDGSSACRSQHRVHDAHGRMLLQHHAESVEANLKQVKTNHDVDDDIDSDVTIALTGDAQTPTDFDDIVDDSPLALLQEASNWTSHPAAGGSHRQHRAQKQLLGMVQVDQAMKRALSHAMSLSKQAQEPTEPAGIAMWIKKQMLPQVNLSQVDMQRQVDRAAKSVESCASVLDATNENGIRQGTSLRSREARLLECNSDAAKLKETKDKACQDLQKFSEELEAPMCLDRIFRHAEDLLEDNLRRNWEFFNNKYPEFVRKKKACDDATQASETRLSLCQRDKSLIEATFCELRSARRSACNEYSNCYTSMSESFRKVEKDVKTLNVKTKDEFKAIRRIECFIGIMVSGKADTDDEDGDGSIGSCDWQNLDVSSMNITYPALPTKKNCQEEVETKIDYSEVECPAELGSDNDEPETEVVGADDDALPEQIQIGGRRVQAPQGSAKAERSHTVRKTNDHDQALKDAHDSVGDKADAVPPQEQDDSLE